MIVRWLTVMIKVLTTSVDPVAFVAAGFQFWKENYDIFIDIEHKETDICLCDNHSITEFLL